MNIQELFTLKSWYKQNVVPIIPEIEGLATLLEHNARQPNKQEITPKLDDVMQLVSQIPMHLLNSQQIEFLEKNNIRDILGIEGAEWFENQIKTSNFDPALAAKSVRSSLTLLNLVSESLDTIINTLKTVGIDEEITGEDLDGNIIVRLRFDGKSGINNVSDLKKQSSDWYEIIRAISVSVGEAPEQTRIVGASSGSIIIILSATAAAATVLAVISKKLTAVVLDIINISNSIEDLRHKKVINKAIEKAMKDQQKAILENGVQEAVSAVKTLSVASSMSSETETALVSAVKKIATFQDNGGEIDMIAPPEYVEDEKGEENEEGGGEKTRILSIARDNIINMQKAREEMRHLKLSHSKLEDSEESS